MTKLNRVYAMLIANSRTVPSANEFREQILHIAAACDRGDRGDTDGCTDMLRGLRTCYVAAATYEDDAGEVNPPTVLERIDAEKAYTKAYEQAYGRDSADLGGWPEWLPYDDEWPVELIDDLGRLGGFMDAALEKAYTKYAQEHEICGAREECRCADGK
jgi:hypothetical protein